MSNFFLGSIWSDVGFIGIGAILWGLIIVSGILFFFGLIGKSWKGLLYSGLAFIIPGSILFTQGGSFRLFLLIPVLILVLAFLIKNIGRRVG